MLLKLTMDVKMYAKCLFSQHLLLKYREGMHICPNMLENRIVLEKKDDAPAIPNWNSSRYTNFTFQSFQVIMIFAWDSNAEV